MWRAVCGEWKAHKERSRNGSFCPLQWQKDAQLQFRWSFLVGFASGGDEDGTVGTTTVPLHSKDDCLVMGFVFVAEE